MSREPASTETGKRSLALDTRLPGRWLLLARGVWLILAVLTLAIFFGSLPVYLAQLHTLCAGAACSVWQLTPEQAGTLKEMGLSLTDYAAFTALLILTSVVLCVVVSTVIVWRRSDDRMALLVALMLVTLGPLVAIFSVSASSSPWQVPNEYLSFLFLALFMLVFSLFPHGRFVPHWTRWTIVVFLAGEVPFSFFPGTPKIVTVSPGYLLFLGEAAILGIAQLYRYRRLSSPLQRQQTKWVVFGFAVPITVYVIGIVPYLLFPVLAVPASLYFPAFLAIQDFLSLLIPLSFGVAILRYRLWDIDLIINRTLVYGTLTVSVIGLYILVVVGLGSLIQAQGNLLLSLLATGLIAVLFQPARAHFQQGINRLLYGERDEPARVLTRLGQRLEATLTPDAVLPAIVETVAQALKLPAAAITWTPAEGGAQPYTGASYGVVNEQTTQTRVPLVYQHETVGELVLAPRQPGESLTPADQRFLRQLAPQIGVAVHAVRLTADLKQLTADLQRSRTELVTAREEERRRLRRDLHDGLGSVLTSLNWGAGALRAMLVRDPVAADALVVEQQHTIQAAISDIRRLVYDLRPPALDELGLLGAIHEQAAKQQTAAERDRSVGLQVEVCAPDTLPTLPAAVEVAAYRILQEALTNVTHHASAHHCSLSLSCTDEVLELEVTDDGIGLPDEHHVGVGLLSMRERAGELGGRCEVKRLSEGGTQVRATLPRLTDEEQS